MRCLGLARDGGGSDSQQIPLGAGLSILHIEWMTLLHYVSSVRDSVDIDPQCSSVLRHHWLEES
jgi:hypothetical protein